MHTTPREIPGSSTNGDQGQTWPGRSLLISHLLNGSLVLRTLYARDSSVAMLTSLTGYIHQGYVDASVRRLVYIAHYSCATRLS